MRSRKTHVANGRIINILVAQLAAHALGKVNIAVGFLTCGATGNAELCLFDCAGMFVRIETESTKTVRVDGLWILVGNCGQTDG